MRSPFGAVPVRPNAGKATGLIQSVAPLAQRPQDAVISFLVQKAENVAGMPNFVASETGRAIDVVVRRAAPLQLQPGSIVELTIRFEGDEHGGGYYAGPSEYRLVGAGQTDGAPSRKQ